MKKLINEEEFDLIEDDDRLKYTVYCNRVIIAKRMKEKQFEKLWKIFRDKERFYITTTCYPL